MTHDTSHRPILPHAVDDERDLLAAVAADPAAREIARMIVWPDDFFVTAHATAYAEIMRRHVIGEAITPGVTAGIRLGIPDDVMACCLRIRSVAIMREAATSDAIRSWMIGSAR